MDQKQANQKKILLEARNITKTFSSPTPLTILSNITFSLSEGEKVAIIGKSGEGKSTLLHILGTIDTPTEGNLYINGEVIGTEASSIRNKALGFVFQSFHLFNDLSVIDNVLMPLRIARVRCDSHSPAYKRALQLVDEVGLSHRIHFPCKKLSGGEKQRVAIARAFVNDPDIILADEPTGNLDHNTALTIRTLLFQFTERHGKALILVTHNPDLASLCDRSLILENGILRERI